MKQPLPLWTDKEMMNEILSLRYQLEEANAALHEKMVEYDKLFDEAVILRDRLAEANDEARLWENEALQSRATIVLMRKTAEEHERQKGK